MRSIEFTFTGPITVEESVADGTLLIEGTIVKEGTSKNHYNYTIQSLKELADTAKGMPVYFGVTKRGKHQYKHEPVGEIVKAIFDKAKRLVRATIKLWNTKIFPKITESVKKGWGFSVHAKADMLRILEEGGRIIYQLVGTKLKDLQLMPPRAKRGFDEAQVEIKS